MRLRSHFCGPGPVEVGDGLEGAQAGVIEAAFEGAARALGVFDFEYPGEPRFVHQRFGLSEQAVETELAQALASRLKSEVRGRRGCVHR